MQVCGLEVTHHDFVVTVTGPFERLAEGQALRAEFERSRAGSDWGADGIGYIVQQRAGVFKIHRSGVGPRKYQQGVARIQSVMA